MRIALSLGLAALFLSAGFVGAEDAKPKMTTKEVMKVIGKDKLLAKVTDEKGTDEDKKKILEVFEELAKNTPKKGDAENWKKLTTTIVAAAKDVVDGKEGAIANLKKVSKCGDCHSAHK
ncbi:MAG: hypothetical protein JWN70_1118 [Planctomycetaceae bacterium]|nr:hypothetical protein [Planctomycetaceae bacterium]